MWIKRLTFFLSALIMFMIMEAWEQLPCRFAFKRYNHFTRVCLYFYYQFTVSSCIDKISDLVYVLKMNLIYLCVHWLVLVLRCVCKLLGKGLSLLLFFFTYQPTKPMQCFILCVYMSTIFGGHISYKHFSVYLGFRWRTQTFCMKLSVYLFKAMDIAKVGY